MKALFVYNTHISEIFCLETQGVKYPINLEIHTPYAVLLECCQESLQCENLNHVKFRSQPTLTTNSRSRPRHEEDQAVSMVSALLKITKR